MFMVLAFFVPFIALELGEPFPRCAAVFLYKVNLALGLICVLIASLC